MNTHLGAFEIVREIGRGGIGVAYGVPLRTTPLDRTLTNDAPYPLPRLSIACCTERVTAPSLRCHLFLDADDARSRRRSRRIGRLTRFPAQTRYTNKPICP